jgi:hypothetical protein
MPPSSSMREEKRRPPVQDGKRKGGRMRGARTATGATVAHDRRGAPDRFRVDAVDDDVLGSAHAHSRRRGGLSPHLFLRRHPPNESERHDERPGRLPRHPPLPASVP